MRTSYSFLALFQNAGFSRLVVGVVISAMVAPVYQPVSAAMDPPPGPEDDVHEVDVPPGQALSHSVRKAKGLLGKAGQGLRRGEAISAERQELADLRRVVAKLDTEVRREFERTGGLLAERKVPELIRTRHEEAFARYREEVETLLEDLVNIETETDEESVASTIGRAYERLSQQKHGPSQRPFDPNQLPHEAQRPPEENLPRTTREEFLGAGLVDNPLVQLASIEGYRLEGLPGADDPAYLAESTEVRLSPHVNAKAAKLDHDPVAIYHWVRNHVEWLPTWGAVQDADLTLSARRGNAMDTASLLIALLRASGIPARYVHGTIDVPEEAFRNWAGGFQHIEEAMNYAASGGIPLTGLIEGGNIAQVRMEHVWVEAAVDFLPSRGAVMREADTWLPLDPSFKQYEFVSGLDLSEITELDGETVLNEIPQARNLKDGPGWIEGLNFSQVYELQEATEERIREFVGGMGDVSVGSVFGGRKFILRSQPILPSSLPYHRAIEGVRFSVLPTSLQPWVTFEFRQGTLGVPTHTVSYAWSELNNRKITLSFRPASEDDKLALEALFPEGDLSDLTQIPAELPAYLIQVVPELRFQGQLIVEGNATSLGEEMSVSFTVKDSANRESTYSKNVVSGSYLAFGIFGGSVGLTHLEDAEKNLHALHKALREGTSSDQSLLGREELLGDLFHSGLLSYFGQYDALSQLAATIRQAHFQMGPSAGTFGYVPAVTYLFGIPNRLIRGGAVMDLDRIVNITSTDKPSGESWSEFNFQLGGIASSLEHVVPEQMFSPIGQFGDGVSAVSALAKALNDGQRIYHVRKNNYLEVLADTNLDRGTRGEIESAVLVGREVLMHTAPITMGGWRGEGYVIFDPASGAGAWKIRGGANGGFLGAGDQLAAIFGLLVSHKALLARLLGATEFASMYATIANKLTLVSFLLGINDIASKCQARASGWVVASYTGMAVLFIGVVSVLTLVTGPVGGFVAGAVFGATLGYLRGSLVDGAFCRG